MTNPSREDIEELTRMTTGASRVPADPVGATLDAMRAEALERRATREGRAGESQQIPTAHDDMPFMHDVVIKEMTALMRARKAIGTERYGTPLQPFNTRDAGMDAWGELGDLAVYLRQLQFEHRFMFYLIERMSWYFEHTPVHIRCRYYDGIYENGGPCWTCQGHSEQCDIEQLRQDVVLVRNIKLKTGPASTDIDPDYAAEIADAGI